MSVEEKIRELQEQADSYREIANKYLSESMSSYGQASEYASAKEERYRSQASEIESEIRRLRGRG